MSMLRPFCLAALVGVLAPAATAQTVCTDGVAADASGQTYACDGVDLFARLTPQQLGAPDFPDCPLRACLNDLWGWTDGSTGREYALVGVANGTAFVDVTDPAAPRRLGRLPTATGSSTWRDIKTYGDVAYVVSEAGGHGLQVFDLTRLRGLGEDPDRTFTADARLTGFGAAHNVVVNTDAGQLAAVGGPCGAGWQMYTLADPLAPAFAGCSGDTGYIHDAHCIAYDGPDPDHAGRQVCAGFNNDSVFLVDTTDPADVTRIATGFYPNSRYAHQGWFTEDRRYILVNDEDDEGRPGVPNTRTIVFDVQDLDSPEFVGFYFNPSTSTLDHNLYIRDGVAYQANYNNGLRVIGLDGIATADLSELAFFKTFAGPPDGFNDDFDGAWSVYPYFESGTVIVSDQIYGLFTLRVDPARLPVASAPVPRPSALALSASSPARAAATVRLTAPAGEPVRLALYDLLGRELAVVFDGAGTGAEQTFTVGAGLPAGVAVVRAETAAGSATERITFVR